MGTLARYGLANSYILVTIITVYTHVLCDYVKSFNYDGKKARYVGFTCTCHVSNIMLDSISHESRGQWITYFVVVAVILLLSWGFFVVIIAVLFLLFSWGGTSVFFGVKEMESVLSL